MKTVIAAPTSQQGFSLVEVLITLVIISVGVLGMAALQTRSVQNTESAEKWNEAAALASNLVEILHTTTKKSEVDDLLTSGGGFKKVNPADCTPVVDPQDFEAWRNCWASNVNRQLFKKAATDGLDPLINSNFHICRTSTVGSCSSPDDDNANAIEIQLAWRGRGDECAGSNDSDANLCLYRVQTGYPRFDGSTSSSKGSTGASGNR